MAHGGPVVIPIATATPAPAPTVQPTAVPTVAPTEPTATPVVFNAPTDLVGSTVSQSIELNAGWNLISFNIAHADPSIRNVFKSIEGLYSEVSTIQSGESIVFRPDQPDELNELKEIDLVSGYWIKLNTATTLTVHGTEMDHGVPGTLELGWNLVAYLSDTTHSMDRALYSIEGKYSEVRAFDTEGSSYFPNLPAQFSTLTEMEPGKGYLINIIDPNNYLYFLLK